MNKVILSIIVLSLFLLSCKNNTDKEAETAVENAHEEQQHNQEKQFIGLNNGEKWQINTEMTPFIRASENLLSSYIENDDKDFKALAAELKSNNSQLISSCNMEGESHDNLHEWLVPHLELVGQLEKSLSAKEAEEIILKLKTSFLTFNYYFN